MNDYQREVLEEMAKNETLCRFGGRYIAADGCSDEDIRDALISRYAAKMNDYLSEPFRRAWCRGWKTEPIVSAAITTFAEQIQKDCEMLSVRRIPDDELSGKLRGLLDDEYK